MITKQTPLKEVLKLGESCDKCRHCCSYGSGILTDEDKNIISKHLKLSAEQFEKTYLEPITLFNKKMHRFKLKRKDSMPYGRCVFLDEKNGCKINDVKALHCRIGNCSEYGEQLSNWFYLNHVLDVNDPQAVREWAIYLKTHQAIPGGMLEQLVPDKKRLKNILEYEDVKHGK